MISSEQILNQIEKQIQKVKIETNGQATREAFVAIRALCDVVLDSSTSEPPYANTISSSPVLSVQPPVLKDDDANGESLFDF